MKRRTVKTTIMVALIAALCAAPAYAQQATGTQGAQSATKIKHRPQPPHARIVLPTRIA